MTLQKAQARVQVSPMIMKVACFFSQHSPIFGQPASSQTVTRPMLFDDRARLRPLRRAGRLDPDPVGLASRGLIRPMRFFGMAKRDVEAMAQPAQIWSPKPCVFFSAFTLDHNRTPRRAAIFCTRHDRELRRELLLDILPIELSLDLPQATLPANERACRVRQMFAMRLAIYPTDDAL